MPNPAQVVTGPGLLSVAPLGTAEPISAAAVLAAAWRPIGWTNDGSTFTTEPTWNAINVEEELAPIRWEPSNITELLAFAMSESSKRNLALALNMGAAVVDDAVALEPPLPTSQVRVMLLLDTAGGARWIFRRCISTGPSAMVNKKSPDKKVIPVTFRLEDVSPAKRWIVYPSAAFTV